MQWTTSASHLKTGFFAIIKFLPRFFSETFHHRACPSIHHHPQLTSRVKKLFLDILSIPSLHINCNQYVDANVLRHTSRSFRDPRLRCPHQSLAATRLCAGTSQIFWRGSYWYTPQIGSQSFSPIARQTSI